MLEFHPIALTRASAVLYFCISGLSAGEAELQFARADVPAGDRWMYPFNSTPGTRAVASTFSALPQSGGVDDRFGQFLLKFDTVAAGIPAGLGPDNYELRKVIFTAVIAASDSIPYDPTEDPRSSYGPSASLDPDVGRPMELHGTGFRGGFTAVSFQETSAFGSGAPGMRNAHALGFSPAGEAVDVSHNVTLGFDALPWSIGRIFVLPQGGGPLAELAAGDPIPVYARAVFELDLTLPGVSAYARQSFHQGFIWLTVTSLHSVTQQAAAGFPSFFTKEHPEQALFGDVAASLDVEFALPLQIAAFSHRSMLSRIQWNASPGFRYHVQASPDLQTSTWQNLTPSALTTLAPATLTFEIPQAGDRRFFRISRTSAP